MGKIRVIIPVHKLDDEIKKLLSEAIESVPASDDVACVISCPKAIENDVKGFGVDVVSGGDDCNFQRLVNQAVDESYEYFSVLELDDELTGIWLNNFNRYSANRPDVSCYLMFGDCYDHKTRRPSNCVNEFAWWDAMSADKENGGTLGEISFESLAAYFDYCFSGSVFRTSDFIEVGKLKPSIAGYFWLEYMLRATHNGQKLFVVPKVGFVHTVNRDGSLLEEIGKLGDDLKEWRNIAKQEYFFKEDRNKGIE